MKRISATAPSQLARVVPRAVHADHLRLMRDREPWDIPLRHLPQDHIDPLQDIQSEDFVLAYMLSNPGRVKSLEPADFTGCDRPVIYVALRDQVPPELLESLDERLDCPGYINQLRLQPSLRAASLKECVENLKRLRALRDLAEAVAAWRKKMPTMTVQSARSTLAAMVFPCVRGKQ